MGYHSYHVAILANLKKNAPHIAGLAPDAWADLDSERTIDAVRTVLEAAGHRVTFLEADVTLLDTIRAQKPDICFNMAEGHYGDSRESQIPALLELLQIPYTGSKVLTHAVGLDKGMTKRIWQTFGLATAPWQVFNTAHDPLDTALHFPLFVKPLSEGTGIGVTTDSLVHTDAELRARVAYTLATYHQPVLVERYLSGREVTVGVIGNLPDQVVFPVLEIDVQKIAPDQLGVYTNHVKSDFDSTNYVFIPNDLPPEMAARVQKLAQDGYNVLGTLDVARLDIRFDDVGEPFLLEINTLPGISPGFSDLSLGADMAGLDYTWLISTILNSALRRYGMSAPPLTLPEKHRVYVSRGKQ